MFEKILKKDKGSEFNYCLYTPKDFEHDLKYPLIVFLHGAGERGATDGSELDAVLKQGLPKLFLKDDNIKAFLVIPQCPPEEEWNMNLKELYAFIISLTKEYPIDTDRITLTGMSMGGFGTWAFSCMYPELLAGIAVVCGGGMTWRASKIKNLPIKVFHGDIDEAVPISYSYAMVDALLKAGNNAEFTIFHNVGHNSWDRAYTKDLLEWLISREKSRQAE